MPGNCPGKHEVSPVILRHSCLLMGIGLAEREGGTQKLCHLAGLIVISLVISKGIKPEMGYSYPRRCRNMQAEGMWPALLAMQLTFWIIGNKALTVHRTPIMWKRQETSIIFLISRIGCKHLQISKSRIFSFLKI